MVVMVRRLAVAVLVFWGKERLGLRPAPALAPPVVVEAVQERRVKAAVLWRQQVGQVGRMAVAAAGRSQVGRIYVATSTTRVLGALGALEQFASSGPEQHAHFHQLAQAIFNLEIA
jgi:hypothetical protein